MGNKINNHAFIDSQNLNLAIRDQGWRLDFAKFKRYLKDKYGVEKAYLFIGYINANRKLYKDLRQSGYILIFKPTLEHQGQTKGNVDAELVLHTMIQYPNYNQAVIVSGDGDFYCLVEYLEQNNKLGKLIIPNAYKYSSLLRVPTLTPRTDFLNSKKSKLQKTPQ